MSLKINKYKEILKYIELQASSLHKNKTAGNNLSHKIIYKKKLILKFNFILP